MATYEFQAEINAAGIKNVVPSYAPFCESYYYLQESTEADWNALQREIGINELGILEATGTEVVYEANDDETKKVNSKIVQFIVDQWEKVKGLFQKLLENIQKKMSGAKEKFKGNTIAKIKTRLSEGNVTRLYKDGEAKVLGKFAPYTGLDKVAGFSTGELKAKADYGESDIDAYLRGGQDFDVKIDWVKKNIDTIVNYAFEFKFTKKSIVSAYNEAKKGYDQDIKDAKSAGGDNTKEKIEKIKEHVKKLNALSSACTKLFIERQTRALSILTKVAVLTLGKSAEQKEAERQEKAQNKADKAAEKKEKVNASAEMEGTPIVESYSTEVEKLFNWNF